MSSTLKALFVSPEVAPFAKSGGLADVSGSLPPALKRLGVDVRIVMPFYRAVKDRDYVLRTVIKEMPIPLGNEKLKARVYETRTFENVPVYFVEREEFFDRPNLYGSYMGDYYDNLERFSFLSHSALRLSLNLKFIPGIIHCHDWQTGIIPALLKGSYSKETEFANTSTIFTIHNMGYQGNFSKEKLHITGLYITDFFHPEGLEFWGNISLLKCGINYSDTVTTVSPTYAREIQTPEYGMGMEGVLQRHKDSLHGILNGIDYSVWNPETDPHIEINYTTGNMAGKKKCKEALINEMKLKKSYKNKPLIGVISRLDSQKGFNLLLTALERIMEMDVALVLLGSGDTEMENAFREAARKHKGKIGLETGFNDPLAHRIMAGADIFLIPSRYEPCGLTQMYALKYGTIPLVRATGGLNDSIREFNGKEGNGLKFHDYESSSLLEAIEKTVAVFHEKKAWKFLMKQGMEEDFSWDRSAGEYLRLYEKLMRKKTEDRR